MIHVFLISFMSLAHFLVDVAIASASGDLGVVQPIRSDLQTKCGELMQSKKGNVIELKERVLRNEMAKLSDSDLGKHTPIEMALEQMMDADAATPAKATSKPAAAKAASAKPMSKPAASPASAKPMPDPACKAVPAKPMSEPAASPASTKPVSEPAAKAVPASEGVTEEQSPSIPSEPVEGETFDGQDGHGGGEQGASSTVTMFGRQTFSMPFAQERDKTDFFNNMDAEAPDVASESKASYLQIIEEASHGVIPVACMVKLLQGFQELEHGPNQVGVLLAGHLFCLNFCST